LIFKNTTTKQQNNKTTKQQNNKTTKQQNNKTKTKRKTNKYIIHNKKIILI